MISRKDFIKNSSVLLAAGGFFSSNYTGAADTVLSAGKIYTLKNVRLETGFEYEGGDVVNTKTALFCIEVVNGKIESVKPNNPEAKGIDAKGRLLLPAFKDMHAHLDKMLFGLPWRAVSAKRKTVKDMIAYEQRMIPEWAKTANGLNGWTAKAASLPNGELLTVTATTLKEVGHIRGLGFIGLLASGSWHQSHHLMMAKGEFDHSHGVH